MTSKEVKLRCFSFHQAKRGLPYTSQKDQKVRNESETGMLNVAAAA